MGILITKNLNRWWINLFNKYNFIYYYYEFYYANSNLIIFKTYIKCFKFYENIDSEY